MSKDKQEDDAKKIVREETEPIKRNDAPGPKPKKPEQGGFRDLFEDMWGDFEEPQDIQRKGKCDEFGSLGQRQPNSKSRR